MDVLFSILYILLAVAILLLMVVIHEFGHYVAGKILKFKINEFAVGFGPKILSKKKKNGEVFSLRAIPLGGYCAFEGEESDEGVLSSQAFVNEKPWKRIIVFLSGAFFNLISAVIFSFIFILVIGYAVPTVGNVYTDQFNNPYNNLISGDKIIALSDKEISVLNSFEELSAKSSLGDTVVFTVIRNGETIKVPVVKKKITVEDSEYDGFGFTSIRNYEKAGFGSALVSSVPFTGKMSWTILGTFGKLITGKIALTSLSGPVGTITEIANVSHENWRNILLLLPLLAANLAVFNLLPIPALDGSKVVFTTIEWIRGKPVNRKVENIIHFAGLILIFGLVIIVDILRFL